jgi:hypothetical protein
VAHPAPPGNRLPPVALFFAPCRTPLVHTAGFDAVLEADVAGEEVEADFTGGAVGFGLGVAQSGSSSAKGRFSNGWKSFFQWLENLRRFFQWLEKIFGTPQRDRRKVKDKQDKGGQDCRREAGGVRKGRGRERGRMPNPPEGVRLWKMLVFYMFSILWHRRDSGLTGFTIPHDIA